MRYVSTRGGMAPERFSRILLEGLAPDGGLVVPESYPKVDHDELLRWRKLSYAELAFELLRRFADDIPEADLKALVERTYTPAIFRTGEITPVKTLQQNVFLLGLSYGPTLAFKDLAMQLLGNLFEYVLAKTGSELNILGATSGDTGSAAEYAMRGKRGLRVFMLSPYGKMSPFQTAQMYSLQDANIFNIGIRGVFDDCQDIVKAVSNDVAFKARLRIGTVNSINWARVVAQAVYYFKGYLAVAKEIGQPVSFCRADRQFRQHLRRSHRATDGVADPALDPGDQRKRRAGRVFPYRPLSRAQGAEVEQTSSPSMDISKASNFERFVYDLTGQRRRRGLRTLAQASSARAASICPVLTMSSSLPQFGFVSGSSTHADRLETIRRVYRESGVIIDTHTADGVKVGARSSRAGRTAGVPGDGAAGQVRGHDPRGAGARSRDAAGFRGPREQAAAGGGDGRRCERREGVHRPALHV